MTTNSQFLDYMIKHFSVDKNAANGSHKWNQIKRAFANTYKNPIKESQTYLYLSESGTNTYEGNYYEICRLIGYAFSKNILSVGSGCSVGTALKLIDRNDKTVNGILNLSTERLIKILKQQIAMIEKEEVKLNVHKLFLHLISWENQDKAENKNWVIKSWCEDYCRKDSKDVSK